MIADLAATTLDTATAKTTYPVWTMNAIGDLALHRATGRDAVVVQARRRSVRPVPRRRRDRSRSGRMVSAPVQPARQPLHGAVAALVGRTIRHNMRLWWPRGRTPGALRRQRPIEIGFQVDDLRGGHRRHGRAPRRHRWWRPRWPGRSTAASAIFAPTSSSSGPRYWVRRVDQPVDVVGLLERRRGSPDPRRSVAPSPISRLCISTIRITAITPSSTPMATVPMPSHTGSPVSIVRPDRRRARTPGRSARRCPPAGPPAAPGCASCG